MAFVEVAEDETVDEEEEEGADADVFDTEGVDADDVGDVGGADAEVFDVEGVDAADVVDTEGVDAEVAGEVTDVDEADGEV